MDQNSRLEQLKAALEQVTPVNAAQKRRHTRETLHSLEQRISVQIAAQLDPLLVDLSKAEEEDSSRQQPLSRKRKGVEQAALRSSLDAEDLIGRKRKTERQEGEIRQGRRTYEIVGSLHAGYSLQCRSHRIITGPLTIHDMEDEGSEGQPLSTEEDTNTWEAMGTEADWWEVLNEYMEEKDIEQPARESPTRLSQVGQIQNNEEETKGDTTDRLHETTTERQATAVQTLESDLGIHKVPTAGIDMKAHRTGTEESKEESPARITGVKRRRSRRTQLVDLLASAELPPNGKRSRIAVDYTPTLDKEDTKVAAKDIKTLPGLRHQRWTVGYARSTINKVLAPGQDAGYGLFATSPIESNAIICTYEGAPVDYDEAVADQYRSHYLMTCPTTKRAIDAADFNSCYGRFACDPLDKALYNAICWSHTKPMILEVEALCIIHYTIARIWYPGRELNPQ